MLFEKKIGLTYLPGFSTFNYPYFIPSLTTKIANVESETDSYFYPIFNDAYANISLEKLLKSEISGEPISFNNRYLLKGKNGGKYYLISIADGQLYLSLFENINNRLNYLSSHNLLKSGLKIENKSFFNLTDDQEMLLYEDIEGELRTIDLELILQ